MTTRCSTSSCATTCVKRTDLRGVGSSESLPLKLSSEFDAGRELSPMPRKRSKRPRRVLFLPVLEESATESRLNVERGVDGAPDVVVEVEREMEADGDVERLGCGLGLADADVMLDFLREDRKGCAAPLLDTDADADDPAARGLRGVRVLGGSLLRRRPCAGPRCGVREVCKPMAI